MAQKLTVTTEVGTFTRSTARTYTHLILVKDVRHEALEAGRLDFISSRKATAKGYRQTLATGTSKDDSCQFHRDFTAKTIADGSLAKWADEYEREAAEREAAGPVTADQVTDWEAWGWSGRLDLAVKEATTARLGRRRQVRIYDVATGQLVKVVR